MHPNHRRCAATRLDCRRCASTPAAAGESLRNGKNIHLGLPRVVERNSGGAPDARDKIHVGRLSVSSRHRPGLGGVLQILSLSRNGHAGWRARRAFVQHKVPAFVLACLRGSSQRECGLGLLSTWQRECTRRRQGEVNAPATHAGCRRCPTRLKAQVADESRMYARIQAW
eukprot:6185883-Pleurochrysis_carterae.AAC.4